jgi:S-DNA-T family DNA segregation ATPase FtsK/SpoIIIE
VPAKLPYLVLIIDELADIMMTARADTETHLARIAQMSRAVGIHTIVATQRPSVNVITGVIKANYPARVAFQVSSQIDARTIMDHKGAEALLGAGDMLYKSPTGGRLQRLQGALVSDGEIEAVVREAARQGPKPEDYGVLKTGSNSAENALETGAGGDAGEDEALIQEALEIIRTDRRASTSYIQRRLRIGYNRAASIIDALEARGILGPKLGTAPREILIDDAGQHVDDTWEVDLD